MLPAYNEERDLETLLQAIDESMFDSGLVYRVVLVDDGSTDRTSEIAARCAARFPIHLELHAQNQGLGATIRDGLVRAAELAQPSDLVVTMDADNSHTPELILRMVRLAREGHDVVIASRYRPGSRVRGVSRRRQALSWAGNWMFRLLFPIPGVRDYTCGYRVYRASLLQRVVERHGREFFEQEGFQCMVDILLKLRLEDWIFGEVPLILRYDLKKGGSKMNVGRTTRKTLALIWRRRLGLAALLVAGLQALA